MVLEYLNQRETMVLKQLEEAQTCAHTEQNIPKGEFAVGLNWNGYEERAVWIHIDEIYDFVDTLNEVVDSDGEATDGITGVLLGRSNNPPKCAICDAKIEVDELPALTIESEIPRYAMWMHFDDNCIEQFQRELATVEEKLYLVIPDRL